MNNQSQIAHQVSQLFGNSAEAVTALNFLAEFEHERSIRVPNYFPAPNGVSEIDFFFDAERIGLFYRAGESKHGIDGSVWGVNQAVLSTALATLASN